MSGENPTLNMNGEEAKETDGIDDDDDDWFLKNLETLSNGNRFLEGLGLMTSEFFVSEIAFRYSSCMKAISRCVRAKRHLTTEVASGMNVFDRGAKLAQRARAAAAPPEIRAATDYLREEFGWRLFDRVCDVKRKFPVAVELGCGRGHVGKHLLSDMIDELHQCDNSAVFLNQCESPPDVRCHKTILREDIFPFSENSVDLVMSSLSLHWINDLPSMFKGIRHGLKPDGCFIGSIFCKDTLFELRCSLQMAELERDNGISPHISPFVDNLDIGSLLTGAGFTLLTVDVDELVVAYPTMFELLSDLRSMGENNCAWRRPLRLKRETLMAAAAVYKTMYGNADGTVPATFQVLNFIGWKPDPSQPKPALRGSQQFSLKDLDKLEDIARDKGLITEDGVVDGTANDGDPDDGPQSKPK